MAALPRGKRDGFGWAQIACAGGGRIVRLGYEYSIYPVHRTPHARPIRPALLAPPALLARALPLPPAAAAAPSHAAARPVLFLLLDVRTPGRWRWAQNP